MSAANVDRLILAPIVARPGGADIDGTAVRRPARERAPDPDGRR